jgi:hypothetical protein
LRFIKLINVNFTSWRLLRIRSWSYGEEPDLD